MAPIAKAAPDFVLISNENIEKLKVDSLRGELRKRGLCRKGLKVELINLTKESDDR